jgi:chromosome segregation ATPase
MLLQSRFWGDSAVSGPYRRLRGYNLFTASRLFHREDSIATQKDIRSRLEELASRLDRNRPAEGLGSRVIETVLSPFRRTRIDPISDCLRHTVDIVLEHDAAFNALSDTVESIKTTNETATSDIDSLRGDSRRVMEHLATLQQGYEEMRDNNAQIGEHLAALQTDHGKLREHLAALQTDHDTHGEHLTALQTDHGKLRQHLAALQTDHDTHGEHLTALQTDHGKLRQHLATLQKDVTEIVEGFDAQSVASKHIDQLWADLHRDMTALAEALSRWDDG